MKMLNIEMLEFKLATKTKPIKACMKIYDLSLQGLLYLKTLEGMQELAPGAVVCQGKTGDAWQQTPAKLLAKYDVVDIDDDGWFTCKPKPDNEVLAAETNNGNFDLVAQWGEDNVVDGAKVKVQHGRDGDFVLRSLTDPTDRWIVRRSLFLSTYEFKKESK